jgi:hypothetical protein
MGTPERSVTLPHACFTLNFLFATHVVAFKCADVAARQTKSKTLPTLMYFTSRVYSEGDTPGRVLRMLPYGSLVVAYIRRFLISSSLSRIRFSIPSFVGW